MSYVQIGDIPYLEYMRITYNSIIDTWPHFLNGQRIWKTNNLVESKCSLKIQCIRYANFLQAMGDNEENPGVQILATVPSFTTYKLPVWLRHCIQLFDHGTLSFALAKTGMLILLALLWGSNKSNRLPLMKAFCETKSSIHVQGDHLSYWNRTLLQHFIIIIGQNTTIRFSFPEQTYIKYCAHYFWGTLMYLNVHKAIHYKRMIPLFGYKISVFPELSKNMPFSQLWNGHFLKLVIITKCDLTPFTFLQCADFFCKKAFH